MRILVALLGALTMVAVLTAYDWRTNATVRRVAQSWVGCQVFILGAVAFFVALWGIR